MKYIVLLGRVLFSFLFIFSGFGHFAGTGVAYAAAQGVPAASIAVPLSGVIEMLGGLSILLGYKAKWGAWLVVVFLVPVTIMMHDFWNTTDQMMRQIQLVMFMKNFALLGGALLISYFDAGPLTLEGRLKGRANRIGRDAVPGT